MTVNEFREMKEHYGYTIAQMATYSGVPIGTINKILTGETKQPRRATMEALERVFQADEKTLQGKRYTYLQEGVSSLREPVAAYNVQPREHSWTVEEYENLHDDKRYELIDGKLILMESPTITHQRIIAEIYLQLSLQIRSKGGPCEVFLSPLDVRMVKEENTILEPDLFIVCDSEKTTGKRIEGTPDFVLEVLSPGTRRKDMVTKLGKYMDAGVREYWMIDPDKRVLLRYLAAEDWIPEIHPLEGILGLGIYEGSITVDLNAIGKICS